MKHLPDVFKVGIATPNQFKTPYRWVNTEEGNYCPVLHCQFTLDEGEAVDCYAKLMDLREPAGQIDCINEITGWLIAQACGLPVAPRAFIAAIRASDVPTCRAVRERTSSPDEALYYFCTEAISRSQARGIVADEDLVTEQRDWPHCHATIALDEWLGNADRHVHNLVRKAAKDFVLIDHGQLLRRSDTGPWWTPEELPSLGSTIFRNKLHHNVYVYGSITERSRVYDGYQLSTTSTAEQGHNMRKVLHEIAYWCRAIAPGHSAAWLSHLVRRTRNAETLLSKRFGQLELKHA